MAAVSRAGVGGRHDAENDLRSSKRFAEIAGDVGVVRNAHARQVDGIFAGLRSDASTSGPCTQRES